MVVPACVVLRCLFFVVVVVAAFVCEKEKSISILWEKKAQNGLEPKYISDEHEKASRPLKSSGTGLMKPLSHMNSGQYLENLSGWWRQKMVN